MQLKVSKSSSISGTVCIPGSKSHTIRALFFASLSIGLSKVTKPLISDDALSAVRVCKAFGAEIKDIENGYDIKGFGNSPITPEDVINVGNSGTSLRFATMAAGLVNGTTVFTGDHQIRRRPMGSLIEAINNLGGYAASTRGNNCAPLIVKGLVKGGFTTLDSVTSQYLSSILITAPLLEKDTTIELTRLNEVPYVLMTTWWLDKLGIKYENNNLKTFWVKGNQSYPAFSDAINGDFSSATFFAVLAAISGNEFVLENLDMTDPQGDKEVFSILENMGSKVTYDKSKIIIKGNGLKGMDIDMNSIPDALPAMAVAGCFAEGETRLLNVPQARLKETDRINVICTELKKMGADIEELPDGLVIRNSKLTGCLVNGHYDHRIVMALAVAGLLSDGFTTIDTAESMNVTFPEFKDFILDCGGNINLFE